MCIEDNCLELGYKQKRCLMHHREYERNAQRKHRLKIGTGIVPPGDPHVYTGAVSVLLVDADAICTSCGVKLCTASWTRGRQCDICCLRSVRHAAQIRVEQARLIRALQGSRMSKSEAGRLGGLAKSRNRQTPVLEHKNV